MNKTIIFFAAVGASAAMMGCSKETLSSRDIRTNGIAALIDVTAESDALSTVQVVLKTGGSSSNTYVILDSIDKLVAQAGEETKSMSAADEGEYEAEFPVAAADTEFKVMFEREVDDDALGNRGTMPAPFSLGALPTMSPSRAMEAFTITWTPTDGDADMKAEISGSCIFSKSLDVAGDSGMLEIPAGTLESNGGDMPKECDVTVQLTRTQTGTADPAFDSESWFRLHQVRRGSFTSKP